MVIYLDVVIFENVVINSFLLYVTSQIMKIRIKFWSMILSALFGSLYVAAYLFNSRIFSFLPFKLLVSFIMILIVFRRQNIKKILCGSLLMINISMLLAGFCIFTASSKDVYFNWNDISYKNLLLGIMFLYILSWQIFYYFKEKKRLESLCYNVEIVSKYGIKTLKCFLDTGNSLKEPVTRIPVIIVNKNCIKEFNINQNEMVKIPFNTVGSYGSVISAFKADYIKIYMDNHIYMEKAFVGLSDIKISKNEEYDGLLPGELIFNGGLVC